MRNILLIKENSTIIEANIDDNIVNIDIDFTTNNYYFLSKKGDVFKNYKVNFSM